MFNNVLVIRARTLIRVPLIVLATIALTAGPTACGSSDDDGSEAQGQAAGSTTKAVADDDAAAHAGSDKEQVRWLLDALQADFIAGDATGYCSKLTAAGRKQLADVSKSFGRGPSCVEYIAQTSKMTRESGIEQRPTELLSVRIRGNRAVATVSDGGRPPEPLVFVKRDGRWKLPDPGVKEALFGKSKPVSPSAESN